MAKWGEGDPRWIVEERPDHVNVNNWHWTEKNAFQWSKDRLKTLFVNLTLDTSVGSVKITEMEKCEGDASANNRKAKIIIFYEWDLKFKWKGKLKDSKDVIKGTLEIPNLSDENDFDDLDVRFSTESSKDGEFKIREALKSECTNVIKEKLEAYTKALKTEFTQGMILPKKEQSSSNVNYNMSHLQIDSNKGEKQQTSIKKDTNGGVKLDLKDLETSTTMKCTAVEMYNVLTRPEMFIAFTNGSGKIEPKVNGTFQMFGGNVSGIITELNEPTHIVQKWRMKQWPEGHYSTVSFQIDEKDDETKITVQQKGIPESDLEKTREGWETFYWSAIKRTFGFGSFIL